MPNKIPVTQLTSPYLNAVDDATNAYPGLLGVTVELDGTTAAAHSATSTGTLYAGTYMYVQFKSGSSASNAKGQIVFWDLSSAANYQNYIVTPDPPTGASLVAGVTLNAVTKGNYGWIQVAGLASVKCKTSVTKGTPAVGDHLIAVSDSSIGKVDVLDDATALTSVEARKVFGVAFEAPSSDTVIKAVIGRTFNHP